MLWTALEFSIEKPEKNETKNGFGAPRIAGKGVLNRARGLLAICNQNRQSARPERGVWGTVMSTTASSSTTSVSDFSSWWDWIPDWLLDYNSFEETENVDFFSIGIVAGYTLGISFLFWLYWTCECRRLGCLGVGLNVFVAVTLSGTSMGVCERGSGGIAPWWHRHCLSRFTHTNTRPCSHASGADGSTVPGVPDRSFSPYSCCCERTALGGAHGAWPVLVAISHELGGDNRTKRPHLYLLSRWCHI